MTIICKNEEGYVHYISSVAESVYYDVTAVKEEDADQIYSRFIVEFLQAAETPVGTGTGTEAGHEFNFGGNLVAVTVRLPEGYSVEFGEMATYLNPAPIAEKADSVAWATYMNQEDLDTFMEENSSKATYKMPGDTISFVDETGFFTSVRPITDGCYLRVNVIEGVENPEFIRDCFSAEYIGEAAPAEEETAEATEAATEAETEATTEAVTEAAAEESATDVPAEEETTEAAQEEETTEAAAE